MTPKQIIITLAGIAVIFIMFIFCVLPKDEIVDEDSTVPPRLQKLVARLVAQELERQAPTYSKTEVTYTESNAPICTTWAEAAGWTDDGTGDGTGVKKHVEFGFRPDGHMMWRLGNPY